jgi:site-specific recombinase XerD
MASLYRKPIVVTDPRTGRRVKTKSKKWWGRYRDQHGTEKRVPLATDKRAAETLLNELVRKVERAKAGLVDPFELHHQRPLAEHIRDFKKYLQAKERTHRYISETIFQVRAVVTGCKFQKIQDLSPSRVQEYLASLREGGRGASSSNHYLRAIKMFARWLVRDRRTHDNCLAHLSTLNEDVDRRHVRRPLTVDEFARLVQTAETSKKIRNINGPDRAILYIVGAYTGYRRNEIGSVTKRSFCFDSEPPTLTVEAGYSKHRRTDVLPLRKDFAQRIRQWLEGKKRLGADRPLFRIANTKTAEIIRRDLAVARAAWIKEAAEDEAEQKRREKSSFLAYQDDQQRVVDFHSLRSTFITNLSLAGVQPKAAQTLARHSDINLTMNTYTMLQVGHQAAAVETLPPVPEAKGREDAKKGRKRQKDATTSPAATEVTEPTASEDVARILAAWAQIPADVRERLLTGGQTPQSTVAS